MDHEGFGQAQQFFPFYLPAGKQAFQIPQGQEMDAVRFPQAGFPIAAFLKIAQIKMLKQPGSDSQGQELKKEEHKVRFHGEVPVVCLQEVM